MSNLPESTLTTPSDRDLSKNFKIDTSHSPLTDKQTINAMKVLNKNNFPEVERRYTDPVIDLQKIGLFSFVPARGAVPNNQGIYGFAKIRGNFANENEANERAEYLIRNVDSYHQIYHTYVGRPFPLTASSDFSKEVTKVDIKKELSNAVNDDVKKKREKEQKEIEEIKEREKELLEDVKKDQHDEKNLEDLYTTLKVKKAQLSWTYIETEKKVQQMAGLIAKTRREIEDLEDSHPELKTTYYQRYIDARRQAGLPVTSDTVDTSFMRYLVEDVKLPGVDIEYNKLFNQ
jgi:hypothetical protein